MDSSDPPRKTAGANTAAKLAIGAGSLVVGLLLILALVVYAGIDMKTFAGLLMSTDPVFLAGIICLTCVDLLISAEKWRIAARAAGVAGGARIRRRHAFFYTALGGVLGHLLLAQVSTAMTRGLGARFHAGASVIGGMAATFFEQCFDLLVAICLFAATALVIGDVLSAGAWPVAAALVLLPAFILVVRAPRRVFGAIVGRLAATRLSFFQRAGALLSQVGDSGALAPAPVAALFGLAGLRFIVQASRATIVAASVAMQLGWWIPAVSLPAAQLSFVIALTPGSLGITEWGWSSAIALLGAPVAVAGTFVLLHRVQVFIGYLAAAVLGALLVGGYAVLRREPVALGG